MLLYPNSVNNGSSLTLTRLFSLLRLQATTHSVNLRRKHEPHHPPLIVLIVHYGPLPLYEAHRICDQLLRGG